MRKFSLLLILVFVFVISGCDDNTDFQGYHAYYLNKEKTKIVQTDFEIDTDDTEQLLEIYMKLIQTDSSSVDLVKPVFDSVSLLKYQYDGNQLSLYFDTGYQSLSVSEEVLCRAAIVRTMMQIPGVSCVSFYIGDAPLEDSNGNLVGVMTNESFVENPGEQINSIQTATIQLYFANGDGDCLIGEKQEVSYISNISMEKLIIEYLLKGPENKELRCPIPAGTNLISVSTTNGTCYVNFDEGFMNQQYDMQEGVVIYSIVNSLSELPTVNQVQISVNGNNSGVYRDSFSLETIYERNLDYVAAESFDSIQEESETTVE